MCMLYLVVNPQVSSAVCNPSHAIINYNYVSCIITSIASCILTHAVLVFTSMHCFMH